MNNPYREGNLIHNFFHPHLETHVTLKITDNYWGQGAGTAVHDGFVYFEITNSNLLIGNETSVVGKVVYKDSLDIRLFGIVGDGVIEESDAIQTFFKYIYENNVGAASINGTFKINKTLYLGEEIVDNRNNANLFTWKSKLMQTKTVYGDCQFNLEKNVQVGLKIIRAYRISWHGFIRFEPHIYNYAFSLRLNNSGNFNGAVLDGVAGSRFSGFFGKGLIEWAVIVNGFFGGSHQVDLGDISARDCGSGQFMGQGNGNSLESTWTYLGTNNVGQTSKKHRFLIQVDTMPPENLLLGTVILKIGDEPYYIDLNEDSQTDLENNIFSIYPKRGFDISTIGEGEVGGTLRYFFGGAVAIYGWQANHVIVNRCSIFRGGIGIWAAAQSNPNIVSLLAEASGVPIVTGRTFTNPSHSYKIGHLYYESCTFDLVHLNGSTSQYGSNVIMGETNLDLDKVKTVHFLDHIEVPSTILPYKGRIYQHKKKYYKQPPSRNRPITIDYTGEDVIIANFDKLNYNGHPLLGCPIEFKINKNLSRIFGLKSSLFTIYGSGINRQPTGAIKFVSSKELIGTTPKYKLTDQNNYTTYPEGTIDENGAYIAGNAVPELPAGETLNPDYDIIREALINNQSELLIDNFNSPFVFTVTYDVENNSFDLVVLSGVQEPVFISYTPTSNFDNDDIVSSWNSNNPSNKISNLKDKKVLIKDNGNNYTLTLNSTFDLTATFLTEGTGEITVNGASAEATNVFGGNSGSSCLWEKIGSINQITIKNR